MIVRTGTSNFGLMWLKYREKKKPLSRAMEYTNRLVVVIDPFVPCMKHSPSMQLMMVDAARLFVA